MLDTSSARPGLTTNLDVKRFPAVRLSDPARPDRPPPCGTAHNRSRTARTGDGGPGPCHSPGPVQPFVPEVSVAQAFASDASFTATIGV
ncbi:hypothetical protein GCM10010253_31780 [Streptomyces badius]|uniref:Uncharacterized protein n=1 Tax=Streptomyces badius TaxID=1941 RepID=A0ABQ2T725_STRBA|nr:hypothetical protein GCM10010253_31780 [Streptomyces badius]